MNEKGLLDVWVRLVFGPVELAALETMTRIGKARRLRECGKQDFRAENQQLVSRDILPVIDFRGAKCVSDRPSTGSPDGRKGASVEK